MRNPNRIPIILKFFRENPTQLSMFLFNIKLTKPVELSEEFEKFWLENPDLRLGQALINYNVIKDSTVWFKEEDNWLIDHGYFKLEEIKFWGVNYDKEGNRLPETQYKLLKDLDIEHIKNIIKWFEKHNPLDKINPFYLEYFNKRLNEEIQN